MKRNLFLQLIILFCLFAIPAHSQTLSEAEARAWVMDKGDQLLDAFIENDLEIKYKKLDNLFTQHVDLTYIGKFVIGKYWRAMTPEQQIEYQKLFERYALGVYKAFPLTFKERVDYRVDKVNTKGKFTEVTTLIDLKKAEIEEITLTFYLDNQDGEIKIVDMKLLESSLILSYRSRFQQMVLGVDEDMTWFLEDFETMVKSTEINNQLKLEAQQNR